MNKKAIALLSGGLDSILAIKLLQEQGIEVEAMNFYIEFAACGGKGENVAARAARILGVHLTTVDITKEYLELFKDPKHGYGANVNPCLDCKIFMLKKAKEYMSKVGASFIVTGEVLGQRPMSQRRDALNLIDKETGLKGILLRPLCALQLDPTLPEIEGVVDRNKLMGIVGRGRKDQIALAEKFGIKEYPNPAGGCLLTDPGFSDRVKDLFRYNALDLDNLRLLKYGRHFRIAPEAKLIVGRDDRDNELVESQAKEGDLCMRLKDYPSPFSLLRGTISDDCLQMAARIVAYHTKFRNQPDIRVDYWKAHSNDIKTITVQAALLEEIEKLRL